MANVDIDLRFSGQQGDSSLQGYIFVWVCDALIVV